ncbi:MAG: Gfo/Idh/MocA family oxidoreductase [Nitrospira sp.]|nr:Gfo/Idh/MocA family oxidoreductase [bacterium]MBL7048810.1 Gfo/Idh/MocA family oxidoreductase [Nitrospira sp.]
MKKINVALIGIGSIGVHHARIFSEMEDVNLIGVVDPDASKAAETAKKYNCKAYSDYKEVLPLVDALSIAAPTSLHYEIGMSCLQQEKDLMIEKPITTTLNEAETLIQEAEKRNLVLQVGHLERFNSGVSLMSTKVNKPNFIESHRLSPFTGRSSDIDVTLDLMIHDIDIILSLVNSDIKEIRAAGSKILTNNIDIAHAWIEFENGCIAEAVTSRMADDKLRLLKVFQKDSFMSLNYQSQELICYEKNGDQVTKKVDKPVIKEPLKEQLLSFINCVKTRTEPVVSGHEGREALKVALKISALVSDGLV